MSKKRMSNKKFMAIWIPCIAAAAAVGLALEIVSNNSFLSSVFDIYLGRGEMHIDRAEGTEDWNSTYYEKELNSTTESRTAGEKLTEELANEGIVLLKNDGTLPIPTTTEITLLGRGSVDSIYGGSGSGNIDASTAVNARKGLEDAGYTIDEGAYNFFNSNYSSYPRASIVMDNYNASNYLIGEIPTSKYSFDVKSSNAAIVFISRGGGEGGDLSTNLKRDAQTNAATTLINDNANAAAEVANYVDGQHQLEMSKEERDMVAFAKQNYSKVVVVLNSSNAFELGELEDDNDVNGILWIGSPGSRGFAGLGNIVSGKVNPSGHLPDIYVRDLTKDPTFENYSRNGIFDYTGIDSAEDVDQGDAANYGYGARFVQYEEGIYIGYRYYETAATEGYIDYDDTVVYPFGHGLSYTTFEKELVSVNDLGETIEATVRVKNTGSVAGKEVVQIYYTAPYTDGGIEKASTNLIDFGKTQILKPNGEETITLTFLKEDMASYDWKNNEAYVLDAGTYTIELKENSHDVVEFNGQAQRKTLNLGETIYRDGRPSDVKFEGNQFDDVSAMFTEGTAKEMSRANFSETYPTAPTSADADPDTSLGEFGTIRAGLKPYENENVSTDVAPTTGADHGLQAINLRGLRYDDPTWDLLLEQLTEEDYQKANAYLAANAFNTPEISSIGKLPTEDHDGPQGWSVLWGARPDACAYLSEPVIAATFNKELAREMGESIGEEALQLGYNGWYGPAMNMHRSAFSGRNFEYYSEDPMLSGLICTEVIEGAASKGVVSYLKHFALNDQEAFRVGNLCTWATEQAIREIYLKPYEKVVKNVETEVTYISDNEGNRTTVTKKGALGMMSSFNRIGTTWAGGSKALMTNVLRGEWGFEGVAISDFNLYDYTNADQGMRAGTDMQLTFAKDFEDKSSATAKLAIRQAIKNMTYATINSNAADGIAPGTIIWWETSPWRIATLTVDIALFAFALIATGFVTFRVLKYRKEDTLETTIAE